MSQLKDDMSRVFLAYPNGNIIICTVVTEHADRTIVQPIDGRNKVTVMLNSEAMKTFHKIHEAISWIQRKQPKAKAVRKIMIDSPLYRKRMREINEKYAPRTVDCSNCNSPRHISYKCQYCDGE